MSDPRSTDRHARWSSTGALLVVLAIVAIGCRGDGVPPAAAPTAIASNPISIFPTDSINGPSAIRPPITWDPIPFPDSRKQEMLSYVGVHYGLSTFRLVHPQVIVEHFTATTSFGPVFNTFAADEPHLGELPGTCAHFVIDTNGTIYQLVPLELMCRHTVGLNYTAIGIEMVGESDPAILGNPPQLTAALNLTLWLMQRFHIELRNVIGHNESLTSPFHKELVLSFRCQTHQDWSHADMEVFRSDLARLAARFDVATGPPATPVNSGC
jgi:N-acetylmuramoyl-L-alanine amidase